VLFSGGFETPYTFLTIVALLGSLLTVAYALWLVGRIFLGEGPEGGWQVEKQPLAMMVPTVFLAVLALVEGLFPAPLFDWVAHELTLLLGG
jgi:NADH:ubiquinone oxidoreductase subunit 4 (subunit M)